MKKNARRILKYTLLYFAGACVLGGIILGITLLVVIKDLPTLDQITNRQIPQSTKIYDRTGTVLLYEVNGGQRRTLVSLSEIPQTLKEATVAVEDEGFYSEPAFDWKAILRALAANILHGHIVQGASTITQQLARNAFLTPEQTIARKVREFVLAIELNRHYSKDQILELYLNEIPYGPTFYGVQAASEAYFNKSAKDLNLAEATLLAAIPKGPTYYSPWGTHQKELLARQKFIIDKMFKLGEIKKSERDEALAYSFTFAPRAQGIKAPHFVMAVVDYLVQKYGEDLVQKGGLRVNTTLDWDLEQVAEKAVADGATRNEELYQGKNAALVAEDPSTGQILAMVGSRDYFDSENEGNFNVATQGLRQPGSALKPFVYLTAFQKGYTPDTVLFDVPTEFAANAPQCPPIPDFSNDNQTCFHPQNFDNIFRGPVSMKNALAQSINIPAVKTLYLAGLKDVIQNANSFGLSTLDDPSVYGLSLVLGGGAVKLVDLIEAYSVLAQDGVKHQQSMVLQVTDSKGATLESYQDKNDVVADAQSVRLINNILSDVDARRGLFSSSLNLTVFPDRDVALKTGTSNDYRDAWTLGYTPDLVVGVWAGNNDNSAMQRHGSSILAAVPIWHAFMQEAINHVPAQTFTKPDPTTPQKPILAGNFIQNNEVHTILYYVKRSDPQGPPPSDPTSDSQFTNWETAILDWASKNQQVIGSFIQASSSLQILPGTSVMGAAPTVIIDSPKNGSAVGSQDITILARITGRNIAKVQAYFNNSLVQEFKGSLGSSYQFVWSFRPQNINPQNSIDIQAFDSNQKSGKGTIIVYQ